MVNITNYEPDQILSTWNDVKYEKGAKMYQNALRGGGKCSNYIINKKVDNVTLDFLNDRFISIRHPKKNVILASTGTFTNLQFLSRY